MIYKGNHVKFARFVVLAVSEEAYFDLDYSGYHKNIIQQLFNVLFTWIASQPLPANNDFLYPGVFTVICNWPEIS